MSDTTSDPCRTRTETDALGSIEMEVDALCGIHTVRGVSNFPFLGRRFGEEREFVRAFAHCKWAAALANHELGQITIAQRGAIVAACRELADGALDTQLIVDLLEGSGGTSTNMNVNEVLANRAEQLLGGTPGSYKLVHPNDHVNRSQSTNDVYPSALKMAVHARLRPLTDQLALLASALDAKARIFADILHLGRTCLQDAQPMRLGNAFAGYASLARRLSKNVLEVRDTVTELPLGGTAIGTGFGSPAGYKRAVFTHLAELTSVDFVPAADPFDAMQNLDALARVSSELKTAAVSLAKVAADLILLSAGPTGGINELRLPAVQAGSSIMPGKVNPVVPISVCQVAHVLVGNDTTVTQALQNGQLEINHFEPVIAARLFESIGLLERCLQLFRERCIDGIEANTSVNEQHLLNSSAIATSLIPMIGYAATSNIVRESHVGGETLSAALARQGLLTPSEIHELVLKTSRIVP